MSTPLIAAISAVASPEQMATLQPVLPGAMPVPATAVDATGRFGQLVTQGVANVNSDLVASQVDMQRLATGNSTDLHRIIAVALYHGTPGNTGDYSPQAFAGYVASNETQCVNG